MNGDFRRALWRCPGCGGHAYGETRPAGWAWTRDADGRALRCGACAVRARAESAKPRRGKANR